MASGTNALYSLNAGEVSRLALGRVDLAKMRMAMEVQENLLPKVLGPAAFRPGTAMQTRTKGDQRARLLPFVSNIYATAELELTAGTMRILVGGVPVSRGAVTATVTNGDFATDLSGWTSIDEAGTSSTFDAGELALLGNGVNSAGRQQVVTVTETGTEHALRVVVSRGPVTFMVGSGVGLDDYVARTDLRTGAHSLAFTPTGDFVIDVRSSADVPRRVASIQVEAAGVVELPSPWGADDLRLIRHDQSGDVLFCACIGAQQRRIERRSQRSWSIAVYEVNDGPFRLANTTATLLSVDATKGPATLTASAPMFRSGHVGALFRLNHGGQFYSASLAGEDQYTGAVRVSGLTASRYWNVTVSGTWSGTLMVQRSVGTEGAWTDWYPITANGPLTGNDQQDNLISFFRVGFKPGDYSSGVAEVTITYAGGGQNGVMRITSVTSNVEAEVDILKQASSTAGTANWSEGAWSEARGWPSAIALFDGRLWWARGDMLYGSISDAFESYDAEKEGDAGPISRSIATGGFDRVHWLLGLQRLLAGTAGQEVSIRSSSFDEPLTPSAFTARTVSTRGSADIGAVRVDAAGIYVQRKGTRVLDLSYDVNAQDYRSQDLTRINEDICGTGVVEVAVQREPETRVWFVLADGSCAVLTYDRADEVVAWTPVRLPGGFVESVCVTPQIGGDRVTLAVMRTINGNTRRYVEAFALPAECTGGTLSKNVDCHVVYDGVPTTTITGLGHLEGKAVAVWADGKPLVSGRSPVTVTGGAITLPAAASKAVVGLPYGWRLKSTKLAPSGSILQKKRLTGLGLVAADLGWKGIRIGGDFTTMRGLPATYNSRPLQDDEVVTAYDQELSGFPGGWDTDSRFCMEGISPYPATIMALVMGLSANDRGQGAAPRQAGDGG